MLGKKGWYRYIPITNKNVRSVTLHIYYHYQNGNKTLRSFCHLLMLLFALQMNTFLMKNLCQLYLSKHTYFNTYKIAILLKKVAFLQKNNNRHFGYRRKETCFWCQNNVYIIIIIGCFELKLCI